MKPRTKVFAALICAMLATNCCGFSEELLPLKNIVIAQAQESVPPSESLLREIRDARSITDWGIDLRDHGALSNNIIVGRISRITVTYTLVSVERVEKALRRILTAPAPPSNIAVAYPDDYCHTFTTFVWAHGPWGPVAAATVKHTEGQDGYFLIWDHGIFGYRDPMGKWWFGMCRAALKDSPNSPELGNNPREDGNDKSD